MMECNKEEAIRAKGIAERKMQNKDFDGARKIALKAQQLDKVVDDISQILMICDVHCAADKKQFGNEMDWYGILQVEQTADEATIKKQYRKFALSLHPDKNKFPGAEAAFKLIGEAQRVLLDKGKRSLHDIKRKAPVSKPAPPYRPQQRATYNVGVQNNLRSNFIYVDSQRQHTRHLSGQWGGSSNGRATFWTACPFCNVSYQYYVEIMNKPLICQTCNKPYVAHERSVQGATTGTKMSQSSFPQRKDATSQGFTKVELKPHGNLRAEQSRTEFFQKKGRNSELGSKKVNGKRRRKKYADSSESCHTDSSVDTEDVLVDEDGDFEGGVNSKSYGERPRRSDRRKQKVSYKENLSDDEDSTTNPKKAKGSGPSCASEEEFNGRKESSEVHINSVSASYPELYEYPDPDFNDFDMVRNEECFSIGQIWAVYDTLDAMPRFYARIRKVFSHEFKLQVTWLEPDPDDEDEIRWVIEGLPTSCGKFRHGSTENTEDRLMFSHMVNWEKCSQRDTYKILPRKGDIWAIFKNWDIKWKSVADHYQKYEYEIVEILSEYTDLVGATVACLGKLKGFVSLFCRISKEGKDAFQIKPGELYQFSHMISSFKLTGKERQGVPKGSFELDPASLPKNIEEIAVPEAQVQDC